MAGRLQDDEGGFLAVIKLTKTFGGLAAVKEVSFRVRKGMNKAVIGPNGAGKTTLYDLLTGIYLPDSGRVVFQGKDIIGIQAHEIAALGIARTFQAIRLFPHMTVMKNFMAGMHLRTVTGILQASLKPPS